MEQPAGQPRLGIRIKFRHEPGQIDPHLDTLGESTTAVLRELGLDEAALAALQATEAIPRPR